MNPKSDSELANLREAGKILSSMLDMFEREAQPGVKTIDLDSKAQQELKALGAKPAFKGLYDFPFATCISVNDAIVHGYPSNYELHEGDVVGFDFGVKIDDMNTDAARTIIVGDELKIPKKAAALVAATKQSLEAGLDVVKDGVHVGDIGAAVDGVLKQGGYGNVYQLCGHGIGSEVHEEPQIPNQGVAGKGPILKAGMTICIEPMATLGVSEVIMDKKDNFTVRTKDGSLGAHFENMILVTDDGYELIAG